MNLFSLSLGLFIGFVIGAGAVLFYIRWKLKNQLAAMQSDMEGMFDMTDDLMEDMEPDYKVEEKED